LHRFAQRHRELYGHAPTDQPVELVTARLTAAGPQAELNLPALSARDKPLDIASLPRRPVHDGVSKTPWAFVDRSMLRAGDRIPGPLIITEYSCTTLAPPGWQVEVDQVGQLLITRQREGENL